MQPSPVAPSTAPITPHAPSHRHTLLLWTLGALACVVAWDAAGQDLAFAQVFRQQVLDNSSQKAI